MPSDKKNIILIDWFAMSFRQKGISPYEIIKLLDLNKFEGDIHFESLPGRYRYRDRLSFGNIHIYYNNMKGDEDYPMLELTGQGCREFETFSNISFNELFELAKDEKMYHMTRLDLAYDDTIGIFENCRILENDYRDRNWVSNACKGRVTVDVDKSRKREQDGISIMTGTKFSDIYMRIYDKAVERGFIDGRHWIRCELVLKQQRAVKFIQDPRSIGEKYYGVLADYFRFVTPSKTDSNKNRWKTRKYWSDFLGDAKRISLYTPKDIDYNLSRLHSYVFGQAGASIATYIRCATLSRFLEEILEKEKTMNSKQRSKKNYLIEQCKLLASENKPVDESVLRELSESFNNE